MARRCYSQQFKDEACRLAVSPGYTPQRVAEQLGMHPWSLRSWMKQRGMLPKKNVVELPGSDDPEVLKRRLKEAEARVRQLEMEKEILKKAAAFFAREQS